jgi:hypothetical protein
MLDFQKSVYGVEFPAPTGPIAILAFAISDRRLPRRRSITPTAISAEKENVNHCRIRNVFPGTITREESPSPSISKCIPVAAMATVLTTTNPMAQTMRRTVRASVRSQRRCLVRMLGFSNSSLSEKTTSRSRKARVPQRNRRPVAAKMGQSTLDVRSRPDSNSASVEEEMLSRWRCSERVPSGVPATRTQVFGDTDESEERRQRP